MRTAAEPEDLRELLADCADIPPALYTRSGTSAALPPRGWEVDEATRIHFDGLDAYV